MAPAMELYQATAPNLQRPINKTNTFPAMEWL